MHNSPVDFAVATKIQHSARTSKFRAIVKTYVLCYVIR